MATAWHRRWREATLLLARGNDPHAVGKYGDSLRGILEEMHLEPEDRADPAYREFLARLATHGVELRPSS
jgi:hypothetical protein